MRNSPDRNVCRLAVSPVEGNGRIGPLRTHLLGYIQARQLGAEVIMREDDTNAAKSDHSCFTELYKLFAGIGIIPDIDPFNSKEVLGVSLRQSERTDIYTNYLNRLRDLGLVVVNPELKITALDIDKFAQNFGTDIKIHDTSSGTISFSLEKSLAQGHRFLPLLRPDGSPLYHLASVVDDAELKVTHIVRGRDKLPVAADQEVLRIAFDLYPITYTHTPMLRGPGNTKLSKESHVRNYLQTGITRQALVSYMVSSACGDPSTIYESMDQAIKEFDPTKVHSKDAVLDMGILLAVNRKLLARMSLNEYLAEVAFYGSLFGTPIDRQKLKENRGNITGSKRNMVDSFNAAIGVNQPIIV